MSECCNASLRDTKFVEAMLRRHALYSRGKRLHGGVVNTAVQALTMWYTVIQACIRNSSDPQRYADFPRKFPFCGSFDLHRLLLTLDEAREIFLSFTVSSVDGFKHHLEEACPGLWSDILYPIEEDLAYSLKGEPDGFKRVFQVLSFLNRLDLKEEALEQDALTRYLATDARLGPPSTTDERSVIARWFPRDDDPLAEFHSDEGLVPRHGSGSTADAGRYLDDKFYHLRSDRVVEWIFPRMRGKVPTGLERVSKTIFVPKSWKARRTISLEPATLMWLQEGVGDVVINYIKRPHYLSRRYDPTDQVGNRDLAQDGSVLHNYATIDLSSASDSISLDLVWDWFRDSWLLKYIIATRAKYTILPDKSVYLLKKVAAMGNRLTFLIEVVVFAAIVECAIRSKGDDPRRSRYRVYGDDIVVETKYAQAVIDRLQQNGFVVNESKSFISSEPFRESCGGFFFHGYDVSPVFLSRKFRASGRKRDGTWDDRWQQGFVDLANSALEMDLQELRGYLLSKLLALPARLRPRFVAIGEDGGVQSLQPTNFQCDRIYDADTQQEFLIHGGAKPQDDKRVLDPAVKLFEYLRRQRGRHSRPLQIPEDLDQVVYPCIRMERGKVKTIYPEYMTEGARWLSTKSPLG